MKPRLTCCIAVMVSILFILGFAVTGSQAAEKIVIKMAGTLPPQHHLTKALEMYKELVEKKAGDRVTFQLYPSQQLYSDKDLVMVLPKGAIEAAILNPDLWSGLVPSMGVTYFSCYYPSREHYYRMYNSEAWDIIRRDFEAKGVKLLSQIEYGSLSGIIKKPIRKMEDFKGMRLRAQGEYVAIFLKAMGAAPVVTSSAEVYLMLQRGTIEGAWSGPSSFVDRKWYEVTKYFLTTDTCVTSTFFLGVNLEFWKKLSPDLQKIMADAAIEVQNWTRKYAYEADINYRKLLKEKGLVAITIDPAEFKRWHDKIAPEMEAAYKKAVGQEKGQKILDIIKKTCF